MTRSVLASLFAFGVAGAFLACLPELSALNDPAGATADGGDGGEAEEAGPSAACGDGFVDDDAGEECDPGESVTTTCATCLVQCTGAIDPLTRHCYYVPRTTATYQEAKAECTAQGAHVVTIESEREAQFVDALSGLSGAPYWVGATYQPSLAGYGADVPTETGFAVDAGCPGCFVRSLVASDAGSECVFASDGGWTLTSCSATTAAMVCEREPLGQRSFYCQGPYCSTVPFTLGKKRYLLYLDNVALGPNEAAAECARFDEGRLAVFDSSEERQQLVQEILRLLGDQTSFTAWIGVSADGGAWTWDDGKPVDDGGRPSPWGANMPGNANAGRAFIRIGPAFFDSQLAQVGDDNQRAFICERR